MRLGHVGEGVGGVRGRAESVLWVRVMVRYVGAVCVPSQCRVVCVCCAVAGVCVALVVPCGCLLVPCGRVASARTRLPLPCCPLLTPPHLPLVVRCDLGV